MLVHNSKTFRQHSVIILVILATIFMFIIWTQDVNQEYLQAEDGLNRDVCVKSPAEFQLRPNEIMKLTKPLYGLTDSGDYWNHTMNLHLLEDLEMTPTTGNLSLFFNRSNGRWWGVIRSYVDDTLATGKEEFEK